MADKWASLHVGGDWGIKLGAGTVRLNIYTGADKKIGTLTISAAGARFRGRGQKPQDIYWG